MNISNSTASLQPYSEGYWIISELFIVLSTMVSVYYLYVLIARVRNLNKQPQSKNKNRELKLLLCITIAGTSIGLCRCISDHLVAILGWQTDQYCRVFTSISFALYSASAFPVYFFLWKRQHKFYSNSQLKHLYSKKLLVISYCSLFFLVFGGLIVTVLYQIPSVTGWLYQATESGCRDANDEQDAEFLPLLANVIAVLGQIILLGLLLYPLVRCKNRQRNVETHEEQPGPSTIINLNTEDLNSRRKPNNHNNADDLHFANSGGYSRNYSASDFDHPNVDYWSRSEIESESKIDHEAKTRSPYARPHHSPMKRLYTGKASTLPPKPHNKQLDLRHKRTESNGSAHDLIARKHRPSKQSTLTRPQRSKSERRRERHLHRLIKKVFCLALACVCTDLIATLLQLLLVTPEIAYLAIYDVNLMLNITCVILSFDKWKQILNPWKIKRNAISRKRKTGSVTSQTSIASASSRNGTLERVFAQTNFSHHKIRTASDTHSISSGRTVSFNLSRPTTPSREPY